MRKPLLFFVAASLALGACTPSLKRSPGPPLGAPLAPAEPIGILIWSSRDLPKDIHHKVAEIEGVRWVARIANGMVDLKAVTGATKPLPKRAKGAVFPISIAAMDPSPEKADVVSSALAAGDAVMSETAAAMRGIAAGATVTIAAESVRRTFRVGAIVSDEEARGREVLIPQGRAKGLGLTATRSIVTSVEAESVTEAVRAMEDLTKGVRARIRAAGDPDDDPDDDQSQLLPFVEVKRLFGEFTYRPTTGNFIDPDPTWEDTYIVERRVPLLGLIACNKKILPQLTGAMRELQTRGLAGLIRTSNGCYSPRMQVGNTYALSRHAYGIAVDINATRNPYGDPPSQDPRLVELMERWGFTWGGRWLVPDGMHFEFVRFVDPATPPPLPATTATPSS
jgi:hypothetical protein